MCFDNDNCDWTASIHEETEGPATCDTSCFDCGGKILSGKFRRRVYQQEDEECAECGARNGEDQWPDSDGLDVEDKFDHDCDFGEIFVACVCETCLKLRAGIKAYELKEGCPEWASQPAYGQLMEAFTEHQQAIDYADAAVSLHPELIDHYFIQYAIR